MFGRNKATKPSILRTMKEGIIDNIKYQQELSTNERMKDKAKRKIAAESDFEKMVEDQTMSDFRRQDRIEKFLEGKSEETVAQFNETVDKYREMVSESKKKYLATFD